MPIIFFTGVLYGKRSDFWPFSQLFLCAVMNANKANVLMNNTIFNFSIRLEESVHYLEKIERVPIFLGMTKSHYFDILSSQYLLLPGLPPGHSLFLVKCHNYLAEADGLVLLFNNYFAPSCSV